MNINNKLLKPILTFICILSTGITTSTATSAPVSPDVRQALDTVYLAAKEADMIYPAGESKEQSNPPIKVNGAETPKQTRDPVTQMLAVGLGAFAGMMIMNYIGGSSGGFYGFSSVMFGGMLGDYAYRKYYAPPLPSIPVGVAQRISP